MSEQYNKNEDVIDRMRRLGWKCYVNYAMILICTAVYIYTELTGGVNVEHMLELGASYIPLIREGEYWRLFTAMFLHFGARHLLSNMFLLFFIGDYLERYVGHVRYILIYLGGGIAGNIISGLHETMSGEVYVGAGASGAVYAVLGGLLAMTALKKGKPEGLTMRKLLLLIVLMLIVGFQNGGVDGYAHFGGAVGGFLIALLLMLPDTVKKLSGYKKE